MSNVSEELARLAKLRDEGVLTPDEFEAQKAAVLRGQNDGPTPQEPVPSSKGKLGKGCLIVVAVVSSAAAPGVPNSIAKPPSE